MILEGLVTTVDFLGKIHLAPMGPVVHFDQNGEFQSFILKPFATTTTYENLSRTHCGVLHMTDDVLLIAKSAMGDAEVPVARKSKTLNAYVLNDHCRAFEFRVREFIFQEPRVKLECEVVESHIGRHWLGFNRAKNAVLEAAILATRFHILPSQHIQDEFAKLRIIVDKTAGPTELEAMSYLEKKWAEYRERAGS